MPVRYIKLHPPFDRSFENYFPEMSLLFFDPCVERSATPIGDRLRRIDPSVRGNADILVLRGSSDDFIQAIYDDPIMQALVGATPAFVLGPVEDQTTEPANRKPTMGLTPLHWSAPFLGQLPDLDVLREIELLAILQRSEAICNGAEDDHFGLPGGHHALEFLRLGDALCDPIELSRIADWLLPYVTPNCLILGDSGTILPLLLALQLRALVRYEWNILVEVLDGYPGDTEAVSHAIGDVSLQLETPARRVLLVASVNSSGRLVGIFRSLARSNDGVVIVCDAAEAQTSLVSSDGPIVLCRYPIKRWSVDSAGKCEECERRNRVDIHPRSYQRMPSRDCELVRLTLMAAEAHKRFWEAADTTRSIRLHTDVQYLESEIPHSRHLAVYVDVPRLLEDSGVRENCMAKLKTMRRPDQIIIPRHRASSAIADLVRDAFRRDSLPFPSDRIHIVDSGRFQSETATAISGHEHILLADDALVNGGTLTGLRTEIYRATQGNALAPLVEAFVVIARPSDLATLETVRRRFRSATGDHFHFGELIYLPRGAEVDHGHESCPWCFESRLLRQYLEKLSGPSSDYARGRLENLRGDLRASVLVAERGDEHAGEQLVTRGSFFGELHPVAAFAAGASAAQQLRAEIEPRIGQPRQIVDAKMLLDAYFESILLGAILRTLPERLFKWSGQEESVSDAIRRLDPSRAYPGTIMEIGWAAVSGKLPRRPVADMLGQISEPSPGLTMLKEILALQLSSSL